jgi:hypothetical protein
MALLYGRAGCSTAKKRWVSARAVGGQDVWAILEIPATERSLAQLELLAEAFEHVPFIRDLPYPLLQQEVCRMLTKQNFDDGHVIYKTGAKAKQAYIVRAARTDCNCDEVQCRGARGWSR